MGNNESLPPPPPPEQPSVPPPPPTGPPPYQPPPPPGFNLPGGQFPPTTQDPTTQSPTSQFPTSEFPATQQLPPTQSFPGGPPGGFPPSGSTAFEQPAEPPKKKTGLMIAGGVVAVAVVVAVVLVLTGGDDEKIVAPETTPVSTVLATIPELTIPPEDTLVITLPVITEPGGTKPSVTDPASTDPTATEPVVQTTILSVGEITDDLGVFAVVLPDGLAVDSTPISTQDNFTLASVAGAVDLEGFYNDDVTPGITVIVVGGEVDSTPADVLAFLEPEAGICKAREEKADFVTTLGSSILLTLRGCGPDGSAAKVILVAAIEGTTSIVATYVQGPGIAADLLPQAQAVFESVRLL